MQGRPGPGALRWGGRVCVPVGRKGPVCPVRERTGLAYPGRRAVPDLASPVGQAGPAPDRRRAGDSGGGGRRRRRAETVVSQAWPDGARPRMVRGTISTEPSDAGSKVKLANATGPVPGSPTWLSDTVRSNRSRSHFSPAVKRSSPAGSVIRAASPQPTSPQPRRTHARGDPGGTWASRSPGSSMGTVRTTRLPGSGAPCPGTGAGRGSPGATSFPSALIATDFTGSQCNPTDVPVVSRVCRLSP